MKLIDAVGLKIKLGKRYAYDERRIREIFKETIDDMPTIEAIPIEWLESWSDSMTANAYSWNETGYQVIHSVIEDWRKENDTN